MTGDVLLRDVIESDLPILFEHQRDRQSNEMAAFPARDRQAFNAHWKKILSDESNIIRTIVFDGRVTGNIVSWVQAGEREVGYWLGREYWGQGIATKALGAYLGLVKVRPLYAHVAKHNLGSIRVLEKCGFSMFGEAQTLLTKADGALIEEFILKLEAPA